MIYYEDIGDNVTHRKISRNTLPTKKRGSATQRWDDNGFGTAQAQADSPLLPGAGITHFTTPPQVQLPLQEEQVQPLLLQEQLHLQQELPLLPWLHPRHTFHDS